METSPIIDQPVSPTSIEAKNSDEVFHDPPYLGQGAKFLCNAWADSASNIIADLHPGIFMPNVSSDYRNLEFPEFAQKNLTSQRVTRAS